MTKSILENFRYCTKTADRDIMLDQLILKEFFRILHSLTLSQKTSCDIYFV